MLLLRGGFHCAFLALCSIAPSGARIVDRYSVSWALPTTPDVPHTIQLNTPAFPSGPFVGNGDVSFIYVGNGTNYQKKHTAGAMDWQQWLYMSKNDFWGGDAKDYYPHLSAGRVGFRLVPGPSAGAVANGTVHMFPGNASIVHTLTDQSVGGASVAATTRVLENNAIVTTLVCSSPGGAACPTTLLLSDTNGNHFGVGQSAGAAPDSAVVWWRKENLHAALNPTYLGSCDPHVPLQSVERRFTVDPASGALRMANGSCLWSDNSTAPARGIITSGACAGPQGGWKWAGGASKGEIVHTASAMCLSGALGLGACGTAPWGQVPSGSAKDSEVYLSINSNDPPLKCLVVVPDNNNNTLGVALGVADAGGALVPGKAALVSTTDPSAGVALELSLKSGVEYTLLVGLQTLRDMGCAGIRPQWEACSQRPEDAAVSLVRAMAPAAARGAAVAASETFWSDFWGASAVDLAPGATPPNATASLATVERWYYLAQYLLGCTTRDGKVTSALDGMACVEPVPWGDQFTLDYNLEATFWGAGSSNRLDFIHPVMASTTNPGAVATARMRAQNPGTWNRPSQWPGHVGATVAGAECQPNCPNLTTTGFRGAEWPAAAMPLGDGRLAESDLNSRFSGGLLATNLIQYWEYSHDVTALRERIYPFVKDNAEFYLSYAQTGADGKLMFPYSCAQEACSCRDAAFVKEGVPVPLPNMTTQCKSPNAPFKERCPLASSWELNHACFECQPDIATGSADGYHNSHPDIAFASSSFRNAVRFAKILGVDSDMAAAWQKGLEAMPAYPAADFTFIAGAKGEEFNGGAGFFVEAEYGHHPGVNPANSSSTTPVVWPWCNKEYPVSNFAAMWPTDEIGTTQTVDADLLARAKQTVYGLNHYQNRPWANTNGFCLSWPPAVRVSGRGDAEELVTSFAGAIDAATGNNGCVHNNGGMLENIGATVAINDLLLQSHGGRMRFFPVWNATALGAASFVTLRAYGAFLVSGSIDASGIVAPVSLESQVGGDAVFEWPAAPKVTDGTGATVPASAVSAGVYSFASKAGRKYTISSN
jgi:hypothetical protein